MDLDQLNKDIDSNIKLINAVTLDRLKTLNDHNLYVKTHREIIELQRQKIEFLESEIRTVRKSTLYNFSVYMQTNYKWMAAIVTGIVALKVLY